MAIKFKADQFTATKWDTTEDKAKFANQFVKFVESDFARGQFPKWFYKRLSMTFGHIAHFDQEGFYGTFFSDLRGKVDFLSQSLEYPAYGDPTYTYSDVEKVLKTWLRDTDQLAKARQRFCSAVEKAEREHLRKLKEKYPDAG